MKIQTIDWLLYIVTLLLVVFGIVVIYSITYGQEPTKNFTQYQIVFAILGFIFLIFFSFLNYEVLKSIAFPLYGILLLMLLFLLFTPLGKTTSGATRWFDIGIFHFQPSEFFKLASIIVLAKVCDQKELSLRHLIFAILLIMVPVCLILKQPDFGTAIILFLTGSVIILTAGFKKRHLFILGGLVLILLTILLLSYFSVPPFTHFLRDYQRQRIHTFLNPSADPFGAGYNVLQSKIAIGSGGIFGKGLGYGSQSQLNFIPSKHTDFIFAVAGEAFGFLGAGLLIGLFFALFLIILKIAYKARDNFGTLLCYGILAYFVFSVLINIGMTMGVMPSTGIPLPLISYGGTSLLTALSSIGICQSVMVRHKKIRF
jgi:rod shape determining protein RodA